MTDLETDEDLRVAVYRHFAERGTAPRIAELSSALSQTEVKTRSALRRLAAVRHLVLNANDDIVMAHPFTAVPLGFSVMGAKTLWWGGCAWDSFALPHLLPHEGSMLVATRCPACDRALAWVVARDSPPAGSEVAHFLVPTQRMWNDVVHTCGNQRIYCSKKCIEFWVAKMQEKEGYVMDLATLWRLAQGWYQGRLERGYIRREPAQAKEYFKSVGLSGAFWGLE